VIYRRGHSMRVMVYAGRDPLTGKKKWVSRQIRGTGRAALKEAKQIEAKLLAEVAAGRHQDAQGVKVAELVDRWLEWRQAVKPMSPGTAANYRRCIDLKIKPALGALAVSRLDTATLDRFYTELRQRAASASTATGACATASRRCIPARSSSSPSPARNACTRQTAYRASR
jgi:integrase